MRALKSVFGVIRALFPVFYCGGLLYYFLDVARSVDEAQQMGLGPTLLGLGAVALLFCIPSTLKVVRMFARLRAPGSGGHGGPDAPAHDGKDDFDADAVLARYMAQRPAEAAPEPTSPAAPRAQEPSAPAARPSFGRRVR